MKKTVLTMLLTFVWLLNGCFSLSTPPPRTEFYTFEYALPGQNHALTTDYILKIDTFHVSPVYDESRLLIRSQAFKRNEFSHHRWRANPGDLVADYLARDMAQSAFFRAVVRAESIPNGTHRLTGTVEEFYQRVENGSWQAIFTVSALLVDEMGAPGEGGVVFQRRYAFEEPLEDQTPSGFVAGMSRAMRKFSASILDDMAEALGNDTGAP